MFLWIVLQISLLSAFSNALIGQNFLELQKLVERTRQKSRIDSLFGKNPVHLDPVPVKAVYLMQPLDHFDVESRQEDVIQQKILINNHYWKKPDGPVFLYISGEGKLEDNKAQAGHHVEMAKRYGALVIAAEHRFYGESINDNGLQLESLRHLSSQQALADLVEVHRYISEMFELTSINTWICFGGSYAGALSAWFRLKYPHIVFGAIASSAPVQAITDFKGYNDVVAGSLSDPTVGGSGECLQQVSQAFIQIDGLLKSKQFKMLQKDFKSCGPISDSLDSMTFVSNLAGNIMGVVQYNNEVPGMDVGKLCDIMTTTSDPYKNMATLNDKFLEVINKTCVNNSYADSVKSYENTTVDRKAQGPGIRSWGWQTCTQFGYYQTCDKNTSCPFSRLMDLYQANLKVCEDIYKIPVYQVFDNVAFTNDYYGGNKPKGTRIVFVNGSIDPWHALSVLKDQSDSETAIYIKGTAHCADMGTSKSNDTQPLKDARQMISQQIGTWLKQAEQEKTLISTVK